MKPLGRKRLREGAAMRMWEELPKDDWSYPDTEDPATLGCLLSIVRKELRDEGATVLKFDEGWQLIVFPSGNTEFGSYKSEAEAIARAIIDLPRFS